MAAIEHEWIIYSVELLSRRRAWVVFVETVDEQHVGIVCTMTMDVRSRSEERRVGKECRSRWSPYH